VGGSSGRAEGHDGGDRLPGGPVRKVLLDLDGVLHVGWQAVPAAGTAMVGDDAANDLAPARRLGLRTVLVRTGKPVGSTEEPQADLVLDSVAALPAALGLGAGVAGGSTRKR